MMMVKLKKTSSRRDPDRMHEFVACFGFEFGGWGAVLAA